MTRATYDWPWSVIRCVKSDGSNRFYLDDEARKAVKGIPDHLIPVTGEGCRQATLTGLAIRDAFGTFDYVFHSGYTRTVQTAESFDALPALPGACEAKGATDSA